MHNVYGKYISFDLFILIKIFMHITKWLSKFIYIEHKTQ